MSFKELAAATAILVSGAASAVTPGDLGTIDNSAITINNTHLGSAAFVDIYLFDVTGSGLGVGVVFDFTLPKLDIEFSSLSFVDLTTSTVLATDTDGTDGWAVGTVLPGAHEYAFEVAGTPTGRLGGTYLGKLITFVPTPVPEPSTYALLLAGLGVVGYLGRRRKQ